MPSLTEISIYKNIPSSKHECILMPSSCQELFFEMKPTNAHSM